MSPRGVQGVGAAAMFATALALIAQEFEGRERARRSAPGARPSVAPSPLGRWSAGSSPSGLGWEWIFFVNIPIGIGAIVLTQMKLANVKATDPQPIDWAGLVTFSASLFLLDLRVDPRQRRGLGQPRDRRLARRPRSA